MKFIWVIQITLVIFLISVSNNCLAEEVNLNNTSKTEKTITGSTNLVGNNLPDFKAATDKTLKGLIYLLAILFAGLGLYKKFFWRSADDSNLITVSSRHNLGSKSALLIVNVEGERFLLGQTSDSLNLLTRLKSPTEFEDSLLNYSVENINLDNDILANG